MGSAVDDQTYTLARYGQAEFSFSFIVPNLNVRGMWIVRFSI